MDCVFCKIINGEIPSKKVYEDDEIFAFYDIDPKAPIHFLVIPKEHIGSLNDLSHDNSEVIGHIFEAIGGICKEKGIDSYRVVSNCGALAGQTVSHVHFHVLGGRGLAWPPG